MALRHRRTSGRLRRLTVGLAAHATPEQAGCAPFPAGRHRSQEDPRPHPGSPDRSLSATEEDDVSPIRKRSNDDGTESPT